MLKTFQLHLEHVNPRLDPLEALKYDLNCADGQKQQEESANKDFNVLEIEESVAEFKKSLDEIIAELKKKPSETKQ